MIKKFKIRGHLSIRFRIFIAMTSLVIIAFGGIAILTIPQYKKQSNKYHEQRLERKKRIPLGRYGEPKEINGIITYLLTEASSYVTGQDFYVDGGFLAKGI